MKPFLKTLPTLLVAAILVSMSVVGQTKADPAPAGQTVETIICVRHGEKPKGGLGQLTVRGLNRALALPKVLLTKYGNPQFVFAPNPAQKGDEGAYYYVRPLVTIEPTAIECGLPINTEFGFQDIDGLEKELQKPAYQKSTIFVAWEHYYLDQFAKNLIKDNGGDPKQVADWPSSDFDTIFVFKITALNGQKSISFTVDHEGLNGLSDVYPKN